MNCDCEKTQNWEKSASAEEKSKEGRIKSRSQVHHADKALNFWTEKKRLRSFPGNCSRCGRPNPDTTYRHCLLCRQNQKEYRFKQAQNSAIMRGQSHKVMTERIDQLEKRITAFEAYMRQIRQCLKLRYQDGYRAGLKITNETRELLNETLIMGNQNQLGRAIDAQGLQQISHVYQKEA